MYASGLAQVGFSGMGFTGFF
jgi:hypothetical protein